MFFLCGNLTGEFLCMMDRRQDGDQEGDFEIQAIIISLLWDDGPEGSMEFLSPLCHQVCGQLVRRREGSPDGLGCGRKHAQLGKEEISL